MWVRLIVRFLVIPALLLGGSLAIASLTIGGDYLFTGKLSEFHPLLLVLSILTLGCIIGAIFLPFATSDQKRAGNISGCFLVAGMLFGGLLVASVVALPTFAH